MDDDEFFVHHTGLKEADSDDDGFLDGQESQTAKLPLDPLSKPALVAETNTAIELTFPAATGKSYRVEASPDAQNWTVIEAGIQGNGGVIQRFFSTRNQQKRFFRVEGEWPVVLQRRLLRTTAAPAIPARMAAEGSGTVLTA